MNTVIGIIGGTGLDDPDILTDREEKVVETPFGNPSDKLIFGTIAGIKCILLARHGRRHLINPTNINYRANIWALKHSGCTCVIVSCACGSLQANILPGEVVLLDQFIDRTIKRNCTFYDGSSKDFAGVVHIPMAQPFSGELNALFRSTMQGLGVSHHASGTILVIEGPRFSTKAESVLWKSFGASVVGMTTAPEVVLANELGLPYVAIALVTDMDSWKGTEHVTVEKVMEQLKDNATIFKTILINTIPLLQKANWDEISAKYETQAQNAKM